MSGGDNRVGAVLHGRYRIVELIGDGAMGAVYRADHLALGRAVAVKFLHARIASDPEARRRFDVEARAMSRVAHPNLVTVSDFGVEGTTPYLVMELLAGRSLRDLLDAEGRLAPPRAVAVARQVLAGLAHAHGHGIVHRDVKPENLLVSAVEGLGEHVRVLDFGLARLRDDSSGVTVAAGLAVGTPSYMSPEQWLCLAVDARTDVYAVGILLHEMITGRKPFVAELPVDMMRLHKDAPPPPLRAGGAQVSDKLEWIVACALAKQPDERFSSAAAFQAALGAVPEAMQRW
ncbi:MAG TPA: serine/threonine-protein kinase [Kofleriaceae bacterium]|nr:serine/threonine-protein kinase [Kofleriaceae bacterium]